MKTIIALVLIAASATAIAGQSCRYDFLGNYVCTGTGTDSGYRSEQRRDFLGNDNFQDNRGNRYTCRTDFLGNYVCQ